MNGIVIEWSFTRSPEMLMAKKRFPRMRPGDALMLVTLVGGAPNHKYSMSYPEILVDELGCDLTYLEGLITVLCGVNILAKTEDSFLTSPFINNKIKEISDRNRNNALKGKEREVAAASGGQRPQATACGPSIYLSTPSIDLDPKEGGPGETQPEVWPVGMDSPEIKQIISLWREYLQRNHKRTLDFMARDALLNRYNRRPKELIDDINYTIENGWKSIQTRPKAPIPKSGSGPYPNQINPEISRRVVPNAAATKALMDKVFAEASKKPLTVTK